MDNRPVCACLIQLFHAKKTVQSSSMNKIPENIKNKKTNKVRQVADILRFIFKAQHDTCCAYIMCVIRNPECRRD